MKALLAILVVSTIAVVAWKGFPFTPKHDGMNSAAASPLSVSFSVANNGSISYSIDGNPNPTLTLTRGETYIFNVNAASHPFFIKTVRTTGNSNQYTSGVTGQGVTSGQLTFVVPADAPNQLFYQCGIHSSMGGTLNIQGTVDAPGDRIPKTAWLAPVTPNPARAGASFRFGLPRDARIQFALFDPSGRQVRELWSGRMPAGEHSIRWDGRDRGGRPAPSGPYFYRLRVEGRELSGRFVVAP